MSVFVSYCVATSWLAALPRSLTFQCVKHVLACQSHKMLQKVHAKSIIHYIITGSYSKILKKITKAPLAINYQYSLSLSLLYVNVFHRANYACWLFTKFYDVHFLHFWRGFGLTVTLTLLFFTKVFC